MSEAWIVWGQGGHGIVVAETVEALGARVVGWADREPRGDRAVSDEALREIAQSGGALPFGAVRLALGVGENFERLAMFGLLARGAAPALVHPTAWRSASSSIGEGTVLLPLAVVHARARVEAAVIVNTGAVVEHDCVVESGAHIAVNATLSGRVTIEELVVVGAGAVIRGGVRVGRAAVVGAGAVVLRDVEPGTVVAGNPARVISSQRER